LSSMGTLMGSWMGMGAGMGWGWLFGLLLLAGIVALIVLIVRLTADGSRRSGSTQEQDAGRQRARAILDERYARGEIDTAEYEERLRTMRGDG
jgi:putative membrane protein